MESIADSPSNQRSYPADVVMLCGAVAVVAGFFLPLVEYSVSSTSLAGGQLELVGGRTPSALDLVRNIGAGIDYALNDPRAQQVAQYVPKDAMAAILEALGVLAAQAVGLVLFPLGASWVLAKYAVKRRPSVWGFLAPVGANLVLWIYAAVRLATVLSKAGAGQASSGRSPFAGLDMGLGQVLDKLDVSMSGGAFVLCIGLVVGWLGAVASSFARFRAERARQTSA